MLKAILMVCGLGQVGLGQVGVGQDPAPVSKTFRLDYSSGEKVANMEVETSKTTFNRQHARSIVFFHPGASWLRARFDAPLQPVHAVLEIEHLSSSAKVEFGGTSRITIRINGKRLVENWEVGSHTYCTDRLTVSKMLKQGDNSLEIQFAGGRTTYWLKRLEIRCTFPPGTDLAGKVERIDGGRGYAVVVSRRTYTDPEWRKVVDALRSKHDASVVVYPVGLRQARDELAQIFPRYACFVVRPQEAGRAFVIGVHRMTRTLDQDPYTDVQWGILTGYEAKDALRIAAHREPLLISRAAAGCGLDLASFVEGVRYSEVEKNAMWRKKKGGGATKEKCPDDTTQALVKTLNDYEPQFFVTSGHATHRDWQIGYSYKNGQFRCKDGQLFGLDLAGKRFDIDSDNPKVYASAGNCLIGLIEDRQTMALAWMRSGGVHQMTGYVVSTWFGYGGWGVNDMFIREQGRHSFAVSFYLNNQALVHRLESEFPKTARVEFETWNIETDRKLIDKLARKHGLRNRDEIGLLWDRDTLAFYGDPAWDARLQRVRKPAWEQSLSIAGEEFTFRVETSEKGHWHRPPMVLLPYRVKDVRVVKGTGFKPVVTDNFVLLPRNGAFEKGETSEVVFTAKKR